jgi:hypothetical protein
VIDVEKTPIGENDTAGEVLDRLAVLGADLLSRVLARAASGDKCCGTVQCPEDVTYAPMLDKSMCPIDFTKTAQQVHDKVRGLHPWPVATMELQGKNFKIHQTRIVPGSGKPGGDNVYEEPHAFVNGVCVKCGYAAETFTNAMGVVLAKGMPAADALKQVFAAMPANANMKIVGAAANEGDELVKLVNNAAKPDTFTTPLAAFTAETVDNVPCNIVTLNYADDEDNPITENYAFSTADTTLVKLY